MLADGGVGGAETIHGDWLGIAGGWLLVIFELLLAVWLLSGIWTARAALVTLVMLSSFSGLILHELRKERPKPCGCLAAHSAMDDPAAVRRSLMLSLARNGVMMLGGAYLFLSAGADRERQSSDEPPGEASSATPAATVS